MKPYFFVVAVCAFLCCIHNSRADVKYTKRTYLVNDQGKMATGEYTTTYVKAGASRTDKLQYIGSLPYVETQYYLCDKKQLITVSPQLKIFSVQRLRKRVKTTATDSDHVMYDKERETEKITVTTSVKDLGEEYVAGFKTRHWLIKDEWKRVTATTTKVNILVTESWNASNLTFPYACRIEDLEIVRPPYGFDSSQPKTIWENKGDGKARASASKGWPLRFKWNQYGDGTDRMLTISEFTALSFAKLSPELFNFKAATGFKQVSSDDLMQAQEKLQLEMFEVAEKNAKH